MIKKRLVGVFTERDALFRVTAEGCDPKTTLLAEVMTPNPRTIGPDKPLVMADLLARIRRVKRRIPRH